MPSLLVKAKIKIAIQAHEKVRGILEGEYGSVFKGRSLDFDDLREYVPGDDVKDIDWKATARSGQTLIKRYVAVRKHNILLVIDTGRNMAGNAKSGETKSEIAILISGIIGYLAIKHGDLVGSVYGNSEKSEYMPLKGTSKHLENVLQKVNNNFSIDSPASDIYQQLDFISKNINRKTMIIVIADETKLTDELIAKLKRLRAQHEMMWLSVADFEFGTDDECIDLTDYSQLPDFVINNKKLLSEYKMSIDRIRADYSKHLSRMRIVNQSVDSSDQALNSIIKLLEKQKNARKH